jgi:hypothetical protein
MRYRYSGKVAMMLNIADSKGKDQLSGVPSKMGKFE